MAKAAKTTTAAEPSEISEVEARVIPAPLAAAAEEQDTVYQAHVVRQANHFTDMAPALAKKDRDDQEAEAELQEHEKIRARWEEGIAKQRKEQEEREARENAAANIAHLGEEIAALETTLAEKKAELDRFKKLAKEA